MPLTWMVGDLRTGRIHGRLPLTDGDYSTALNDAGTMSGTMQLADQQVAALNPRAAAEPGRCFLAAVWVRPDGTETVIEAGPIWTHSYNSADRTLKIGAAGLWSYYDHRKVVPVLVAGMKIAEVVSETGPSSLGSIARALVALAQAQTWGEVPVVLPAAEAGTETRSYPGADLVWVGTALRDLTEEDEGPELAFVPRIKPGDDRYLEWVLQTGTTAQPMLVQEGRDWIWDMSVPAGPVKSVQVDIDATRLASRAWAAGAGSKEERLISFASNTYLLGAGWPLLEMETEGTDQVATTKILVARARGAVARAGSLETWQLKIHAEQSAARPGMARPGHWAQVIIPENDPYLAAGPYRGRITQLAGGNDEMSVQFQPEIVAAVA